MQSITISQSRQIIPEIQELQKGLYRVGLKLSESEVNELNVGNIVSLKTLGLGEIGSVFILAAAVCHCKLSKDKKPITFQDLPTVGQDYNCCAGIPIYCWESDSFGKRCLHLTLIDGLPALRTCKKS